MTNNILEPLQLAAGSHQPGSGKGCAMNVISWENGDATITDFPSCSDPLLARMVQVVNDVFANPKTQMLDSDVSMKVLNLGHATVGTSDHNLNTVELVRVYAQLDKILRFEAGRKSHLARSNRHREELFYGKTSQHKPFTHTTYLEGVRRDVANKFTAYVMLFISKEHLGVVGGEYERNEVIKITSRLISYFKRLAGVQDVVTPVEKTKVAVEKMLVRV